MRRLVCVPILIIVVISFSRPERSALLYAGEKGLVAHWSFDEGSGDIAKDKSGKGHDGTITGATYEKGKVGYCLSFDGDASVVEVPHSDDLSFKDAVSIELWVKITGSNGAWQNAIKKWGDTRNYGIYFGVNSGEFVFSASYEGADSPFTDLSSSFSVWDDQWHHIAAVFEGAKQTLKLYVDGREKKSVDIGCSEMKTNDANLYIGDKTPGLIDEVKIYNRPLTPDEVKTHYDAGAGGKSETKQEEKKAEKKVEKKEAVVKKEESPPRRPADEAGKVKVKEEGIKIAANYGFEANESQDGLDIRQCGSITTEKDEVISGKASFKGDSRGDQTDWHEFLWTKPEGLQLEGGKEYNVSFNYKILDKSQEAKFYFLVRSPPNIYVGDKGWTEWKDSPGGIGNKTINFKLDDYNDYCLILGIYKEGAMSIDDFKVWTGKPAEQLHTKSPFESLIFQAGTNNKYNILSPGEEMELNVSFLTLEDVMNFQDINAYQEEHQGNGDSWGRYAKDPAGEGQVVEVSYLIKNKTAQDWIDWLWNPATPLDWSNYGKLNVEVYPLQNADYLVIKLVDQKGILYETSLGKLKANQWQQISVPLTKDRSNMTQINFYVTCCTNAPSNQKVTFYLRNMYLSEPREKIPSVKEALRGKKLVLKSEILDFFGRKVKDDVYPFTFGEGKSVSNIKIKFNDPGFYWANLSLAMEGESAKRRIGIGVIPPEPESKLDFNSPFGVNFMVDTTLGNLAGIKWERRGIGWRWIESSKGKLNFEDTDAMINSYYDSGVQVMPILSSPPDWARKVPPDFKPITEGVHAGWGDFPPNDLEAWGKYVYEVVNRYKDKIKAWEIWNEPWPNCLFFFGGTIQDYVDLLKVAYEQAHRADPNCIVIGLGGTEYNHMRQVFEAGGFPYMDAASIHHYQPGPNPPEAGEYLGGIRKAREVMRKFGGGKEKDLWMTEMGWPTNITAPELGDNWLGISEELQGKYLPRTYVLGIAAGLKKHFWFMFFNGGTDPKNFEHNQGLLYNNLTPKPSFVAYATLTRMIGGLDYKEKLNLGGSVYGYKFEKGARSCFVLWALSEGATMSTPKLPDGVKFVDMMGAPAKLAVSEGEYGILLSDCVIYLASDRGNSKEIKELLESSQISGINPIRITGQKTKRLDVNRILVSIEIQNNVNRDVKGEMKIELPKGWEASPSSVSFGPLKPAEPGNLGFIVEKIKAQETSINIPFTIIVPDTGPIKGGQVIDLPVIKKAKSPMNIDGKLDDWKDFSSIPLNMPSQCTNPGKNPKDFSSVCYVAWDKNYLYFAADVTDDVISCKDIETVDFQHCDYYRLYLNLGHNAIESIAKMDGDDYEFVFTPTGPDNKPMLREVSKAFGGTGHSGFDLSKIKIASMVKPAGWALEVAIPWETLGFSPKEDLPIGIKFIAGDTDDPKEGRKDEYVWGDRSGDYWSDPNKFGDIYFVQ